MDITQILVGLITLLAAMTAVFLLRWLKSAEGRQKLAFWLKVAVEAAEELYQGAGRGAEKEGFVRRFLAERGFTFDEPVPAALIKSAVWEFIHQLQREED